MSEVSSSSSSSSTIINHHLAVGLLVVLVVPVVLCWLLLDPSLLKTARAALRAKPGAARGTPKASSTGPCQAKPRSATCGASCYGHVTLLRSNYKTSSLGKHPWDMLHLVNFERKMNCLQTELVRKSSFIGNPCRCCKLIR